MNKHVRTALLEIKEELQTLQRHTGRSFKATKWKDYNRYQYLTLKRRVLSGNY